MFFFFLSWTVICIWLSAPSCTRFLVHDCANEYSDVATKSEGSKKLRTLAISKHKVLKEVAVPAASTAADERSGKVPPKASENASQPKEAEDDRQQQESKGGLFSALFSALGFGESAPATPQSSNAQQQPQSQVVSAAEKKPRLVKKATFEFPRNYGLSGKYTLRILAASSLTSLDQVLTLMRSKGERVFRATTSREKCSNFHHVSPSPSCVLINAS